MAPKAFPPVRPPIRPGCDDKCRSRSYRFVERQKSFGYFCATDNLTPPPETGAPPTMTKTDRRDSRRGSGLDGAGVKAWVTQIEGSSHRDSRHTGFVRRRRLQPYGHPSFMFPDWYQYNSAVNRFQNENLSIVIPRQYRNYSRPGTLCVLVAFPGSCPCTLYSLWFANGVHCD